MSVSEILDVNGGCEAVLYPALQESILTDGETYRLERPGMGEPYDYCGTVKFAIACPNRDHKPQLVYHNCERITCPVCYETAAGHMARRITERITGLRGEYEKLGVHLGTVKHIVFSPPQTEWPMERLVADRGAALIHECTSMIRKYAKDGFYGGVLILHPWRKHHLNGSECERKHCRRRHKWDYSPHIHYIGFGFFEQSDLVYERTGWVYKRISDNGQARDIFSTVHYQLTHCGVFTEDQPLRDEVSRCNVNGEFDRESVGQHYRYIGIIANCKGGQKVVDEGVEVLHCPKCKGELHKYNGNEKGEVDYDVDYGPYEQPWSEIEWYVNDRQKQITLDKYTHQKEHGSGGLKRARCLDRDASRSATN